MKRKQLQSLLQNLQPFHSPKLHLEQYPTQPHLATQIVYTIGTVYENLDESVVLDLGSGTGVLSIGCALMGCPHVIGVDVDGDCLKTAMENVTRIDSDLPIDFIQAEVEALSEMSQLSCDVVVMNPPFGTKKQHSDRVFLSTAFTTASTSVYSLHKTSTRDFVQQFATKNDAVKSMQVVAEMRFDLPASYKFHKSKTVDVAVDFWRFEMR